LPIFAATFQPAAGCKKTTMVAREPQVILDLDKWEKVFAEKSGPYQSAQPFPYGQYDGFLEDWAAHRAMNAFPKIKDEGWIHYVHVNEKKHGLNKMDLIPPFLQEVIKVLNGDEFVAILSQLTGIPGLKADEMLEGGGLHQSKRGGFLNIHADFTVHPHKRHWRRRVNLLIYLNEGWEAGYRGELELWTRDMKACAASILPLFNRCVIFNTDEDSYHGLPDPIQCPEDTTRKSIALYYFTEEAETPRLRTTNYRARPEDGLKSLLISLDTQAVRLYTTLKRRLGINDDVASRLLNLFSRKKK
jgi:hypothetical protein